MEFLVSAVDRIKGITKSAQQLVIGGVFHHRRESTRRHPIEILKRLQREAFSDLMKLRDRQDKLENLISFFRSSKGAPFKESGTHVTGEIDILSALFLVDSVDQQKHDTIRRGGIRTGINSKFVFETSIQKNSTLVAEFVSRQKEEGYFGNFLSLEKLSFTADINDWLSAIAVPVGAQCKDIGTTSFPNQGKCLSEFFSFGPSVLYPYNGSGVGLTACKSNITTSLAEFFSSMGSNHHFSTFGQIVCQLSTRTKLSIMGLHQIYKSREGDSGLGTLGIPIGILGRENGRRVIPGDPIESGTGKSFSDVFASAVLESQLDESTRVGGWVEMQKSDPSFLRWAVSVSDMPHDELGWGLSLGGINRSSRSCEHFQVEGFARLKVGNRCCLQPGFVYAVDGSAQVPAVVLRSTWSL